MSNTAWIYAIVITLGITVFFAEGQQSIALAKAKVSDEIASPGQFVTIFYDISNPNQEPVQVGLDLILKNTDTGETIYDEKNYVIVSAHYNVNQYVRYFSIPMNATLGKYDVEFSIRPATARDAVITKTTQLEEIEIVDGPPENQLLIDSFEEYQTDIFPDKNWKLEFSGIGPEQQAVVDTTSQSGSRSLKLVSRPYGQNVDAYSAVASFPIKTESRYIGYEFSIMINERNPVPAYEHTGFYSLEVKQWGAWFAQALFRHDSSGIDTDDNNIVGNWEPKVWKRIKVILDRQTNRYDIWVDGVKSSSHKTERQDTYLISSFAITADHPGVTVHYDDVRVFERGYELIPPYQELRKQSQKIDVNIILSVIGILVSIGLSLWLYYRQRKDLDKSMTNCLDKLTKHLDDQKK